jgi:hypothetical protein
VLQRELLPGRQDHHRHTLEFGTSNWLSAQSAQERSQLAALLYAQKHHGRQPGKNNGIHKGGAKQVFRDDQSSSADEGLSFPTLVAATIVIYGSAGSGNIVYPRRHL